MRSEVTTWKIRDRGNIILKRMLKEIRLEDVDWICVVQGKAQ